MTKISGNLIYLRWSATLSGTYANVVGKVTSSINFTSDMLDVTSQDSSGGWKEKIPGEKDTKLSIQGVYEEGLTNGVTGAFSKLKNGTLVYYKFGETTTGENYFTGKAYVSNLNVDGPKNDPASYTFDLEGTGVVSEASN